jgi:hypothetical protein
MIRRGWRHRAAFHGSPRHRDVDDRAAHKKQQQQPVHEFSPEESTAMWKRLAHPGWRAESTHGQSRFTFGATELHVEAGVWGQIMVSGESVTMARYTLDEICAGWPLLSLRCVQGADQSSCAGWVIRGRLDIPVEIGGRPWIYVPLRPMWSGFAINTMLYAMVFWVLFAVRFALRRHRRMNCGLCAKCAYPVGTWGGNPVCTECGAAVASRAG